MDIQKLHDVFLALGTNLGDKEENIYRAIKLLNERVGMVIVHSSFFVTQPVGFQSENNFINSACLVMTSLSPTEVLKEIKQIELDMGRISKSVDNVYSDRIIDIDLILYDQLIYEDEQLTIPHPRLHERTFVLAPLVEIAGQYVHPILNKSIEELYNNIKE